MYLVKRQFSIERAEEYEKYLHSIKDQLLPSARDFALATWHYDHKDHRCPHDSWMESLCINEVSSGPRNEVSRIEIIIALLGAYHDLRLRLKYSSVTAYSLQNLSPWNRTQTRAHGDWLVDEVRLASGKGSPVIHEIEFENGFLSIECSEIAYQSEPL